MSRALSGTNIASVTPMNPKLYLTLLTLCISLLAGSCAGSYRGDVLAAVPIDGSPEAADWSKAIPLDFEVWRGNVHQRPEIVVLDGEISHRSTAACHHGALTTSPVRVRLMALYSKEDLYIKAQWPDDTLDDDLGVWVADNSGWIPSPEVDDGIAILWGPEGERAFDCQNACHMNDVDIFDGNTEKQMKMMHDAGGILDLWRFRAALSEPFGTADDMVVDSSGKRGDEGLVLIQENVPGASNIQANRGKVQKEVPYFSVSAPTGGEMDVQVVLTWEHGMWTVLFRRRLSTGDELDRTFLSGERFPFGLAVFDNTWTDHHITNKNLSLVLAELGSSNSSAGESFDDPLDF